MKKYLLILFLVAYFQAFSQEVIEPVSQLKYLDHGKLDSSLRKYIPSLEIASTYFVLTVNTGLSAFTLAPPIVMAYKQIRAFNADIPIYIIFNNRDFLGKDTQVINDYFKSEFYIDLVKDTNVYYIPNPELHAEISKDRWLTEWFYVYQNKLIAGAVSMKLHNISAQKDLPCEVIKIGSPIRLKIYPNKLHLSVYNDQLKRLSANKFVYLTDNNNNLHILNSQTGNFEKSFDKNSFDPLEFYCKHIATSEKQIAFAKQNNPILRNVNRNTSYFAQVVPFEKNIYLSTAPEIFIPWSESYYKGKKMKHINEDGKLVKESVDKFAQAFPMILKLDSNLTLKNVYQIDLTSYPKESRIPKDGAYWGGNENGFYFIHNDSMLLVDNNVQFAKGNPHVPKRSQYIYSIFRLNDKGVYKFEKYLKGGWDPTYASYIAEQAYVHYFRVDEMLYSCLIFGGFINQIKDDKVLAYKLKGDGRPLVKQYLPDATDGKSKVILNHVTLSANSVFKEKYGVVIYFYRDVPTLEVFQNDSMGVKTLQVISLKDLEGFSDLNFSEAPYAGSSIYIDNDHIYMSVAKKDEYFIYEYPLKLVNNRKVTYSEKLRKGE